MQTPLRKRQEQLEVDAPASTLGPVARTALDAAIRALDDAERQGEPGPMSHALTQLGRCYRHIGESMLASWHLQHAIRWANALDTPGRVAELLCELAEVDVELANSDTTLSPNAALAARDRARDHSYEAARHVARCVDLDTEIGILLRISAVLDRCGDRDDAAALRTRVRQLMLRRQTTGSSAVAGLGSTAAH